MDFVTNPNLITYSSLSLFIPIYFINSYNIKALLLIFHDVLDRSDGVMARIMKKQNYKRNEKFGSFLDAICDKIFVFLMCYFIIKNSIILKIKVFIHILSLIKRCELYLFSDVKKNKSTISGKNGNIFRKSSLFLLFLFQSPILLFYVFFNYTIITEFI
jgi:phosphatidylglycerophosphate synthase